MPIPAGFADHMHLPLAEHAALFGISQATASRMRGEVRGRPFCQDKGACKAVGQSHCGTCAQRAKAAAGYAGRRWTDEEIAILVKGRRKGWSFTRIVRYLPGRSADAAGAKFEQIDAVKAAERRAQANYTSPIWTPDEDRTLLAGLKEGFTHREISETLLPHRTVGAIRCRARVLGAVESGAGGQIVPIRSENTAEAIGSANLQRAIIRFAERHPESAIGRALIEQRRAAA